MTARFVPASPDRTLRRLWLRSLTGKLVLGVVALVLVLVTVIGGATFLFLNSFLLNRLDQQLSPIASSNQSFITYCLRNGITSCNISGPGGGSYRAPQLEWVKVINATSEPAVPVDSAEPNSPLRAMQLSAGQTKTLFDDVPAAATLTTSDGVELRVSAREITDGSGNTLYVVVSGLPLDEVDRTMNRLRLIELLIGIAAVLLAFAATSWGVRRSLRNLYQVTGTARDVAAELSPEGAGLDRRVPVVEPGTEVGQLAESVNTLLSAVEMQFAARLESEHRMRQFLADASHELRTPLTSIRGFAELARMQRAIGESAEDNLDRIESEGTRMSRLVEDLLLLARGDDVENSQPLAQDPIDVPSMLDDAVASARAAFPARTVELQLHPVPLVVGDRDQLLRVARNLITNACVHTAPERPILTRCFADGDGVVIQVVDGGPGLPPEDAAHVFERFWRADKARTRARGGSGLGMSIVATLVRAHGGSVRFESTVEYGSTVTVRLPAAGLPSEPPALAAD